MSWHDFIFSEQKSVRYPRHIIFWIAWWIFFTGTFYSWWLIKVNNVYSKNPGLEQFGVATWSLLVFIKSFFFLLVHVCACYAFIYFVLPRFLLNRNYIKLAAGISLVSIFLVTAAYLIQDLVFPALDVVFNTPSNPETTTIFWSSINAGLLNALKVIALATIIKLLKRWSLKQKEKERLEKEKIEAELELLKAQIHPQFLFNSLNNIYSFTLISSPKAPEMLLKLSDILSYMLYECNGPLVPLSKEIKMVSDYMALEKIRYGDKLDMNIRVNGDIDHHLIAPLLLLRFIENSFQHCSNRKIEQPWINLEINMEAPVFEMKLINGKAMDIQVLPYNDEDNLGQSQKRLLLLYPCRHELKMVEESEIFMVTLEMNLEREHGPVSDKGIGKIQSVKKTEYTLR